MSTSRSVKIVEQKGLCCSCGLCASYCKKDAISYRVNKLGFYVPVVDSERCVNCSVCLKSCPGANDLKNYEVTPERYCYGYSLDRDMHLNAASGGVTTELLCYLIKHKIVDYVTCVTNRIADNAPRQILTNNIDEIRKCKTSKYCPVRWEDTISQIEKVNGSVAVVALPCQVNSLKNYYANKRHNIKYFVSLLCNHTPSLKAAHYLTTPFPKSQMLSIVNRGEGFPGFMRVQLRLADNTEKLVKYPYRKVWAAGYGKYFKNTRCIVCNDPFSKNADIVMGDSYFLQDTDKEGTTFCIVRNTELCDVLAKMKKDGIIHLEYSLSEEKLKNAYKVLFEREQTFEAKNAILKRMGKGILGMNGDVLNNSLQSSFSVLKGVMRFRKEIFVSSLGKYSFLWKLLAAKNRLKDLIIQG